MVTARHIEAALRAIPYAYGKQAWPLSTIASGADAAMRAAGITTSKGAAVFVAQCMVESAYFRTTTEYGKAGSLRYDPYRGRGFIQVTWQSNYRRMGDWCRDRGLVSYGDYFVDNPTSLADEKWAWMTATWYLSTHEDGLIDLANKGDIDAVGRGVHAGDADADKRGYPWADTGRNRIKHTRAAYAALLAAGIEAPTGWRYDFPDGGQLTVEDVQAATGVVADGVYGPGTRDAVKKLQEELGLTADGLWGPTTEEAFMSALTDLIDTVATLTARLDGISTDVKEIKTRVNGLPAGVAAHRVPVSQRTKDETGTPLDSISVGGALQYVVISAFTDPQTKATAEAVLAELKEQGEAS